MHIIDWCREPKNGGGVDGYPHFTSQWPPVSLWSYDYAAVARFEADVQRECCCHVSAARSQRYYLDVTHPDANKGHVVAVLSQVLSISPARIATIGDMPNDVLMFEKSGLSIAMGNASGEVKRQATFVTGSNEQEGFANAMEEFILSGHRELAKKAS